MASHTLRPRADITDIRYAYDSSRSSPVDPADGDRTRHIQPSNATSPAPPTEHPSSAVRKPLVHYHDAYEHQPLPQRLVDDGEQLSSPRSSEETYASTIPSLEDLVEEAPEFEVPEYSASSSRSHAVPASPSDFSELFPSHRRLAIHHDGSTRDGNMNLRIATEVGYSGAATGFITLFHLRMHDLKTRDFSLRRYCRDSGREVCHSVGKDQTPKPEKRPGFQRSLSNALSSIRPKLESRPSAGAANLKRNDSGYGSIHSVDPNDERPRSADGTPKPVKNSIKLEFSNYAQVDVRRNGSNSSERYDFDYWGTRYAWRRIARHSGESRAAEFHLVRNGGDQVLAHIAPVPLSPSEAQEEIAKGGWIPPCSMWISDETIVRSQKDVSE